ncbi:MAG TPA: FAD-dependent oxidoreductase [Chthoniobacterales bacterium]|nr:FAD-dependent oxidoreductase [Chthoniobacterales bacterium]
MAKFVAIIGAGVSGLTCGVLFAERGFRTTIFAKQIGLQTTSGAAAALWFPYDCEPRHKVIPWALETYRVLVGLADVPRSGVSMIELRQYSRTGNLQIPHWAIPLGASFIPSSPFVMSSGVETSLTVVPAAFKAGFAMHVALMDTTIYLSHLATRFVAAGGSINGGVRFETLEDVDHKFDLVINCAGIGARELVQDVDLEPHRGQVAIVPKIDNLSCAIVCDDEPLMYAIPRVQDCVFGGTNELSDNLAVDPKSTARIVAECAGVLNIEKPRVVAERVGLRPYRKSGVRLERDKLRDGRTIIHNYGHGGSGFTLSWGCAEEVFKIADPSG